MHPNDGRVVSNFIVQALTGHDITIYGDGTQTRSFCYVDDLIEAMVRHDGDPAGRDRPGQFGNPQEFTIRELAELMIKIDRHESKLRFQPLPADDPRHRRPDISEGEVDP